jgi:hypothetical protein
MTVYYDDKRLIPEFGPKIWAHRESEHGWHYCKYCYRDVPTFTLTEGLIGSLKPLQVLRCCWECGAGLDILIDNHKELTS